MAKLPAGAAPPSFQSLPTELVLTVAPPCIVIPPYPDRADHKVLYDRLVEFEAEKAGPPEIMPLAILLKDEDGTTQGGLWGNTVFRWLVVELFFIPERFRHLGLGTKIMEEAETIARQRGCIGVWLDTYSFQAPRFYQKLGFESFGEVGEHPPGEARIFFRKHLV